MKINLFGKIFISVLITAVVLIQTAGCQAASSDADTSGAEDQSAQSTTADPSSKTLSVQEVTAKDDFSGFSALSLDDDGSLHLPLTVCAEALESNVISSEHLIFTIPGCWQKNIVLRSRYIDNTDMDAVANTYGFRNSTEIIEFYEKNTFANHSGEILADKSTTGLLAALYITRIEGNDLGALEDALNAVRYATVYDAAGQEYAVFLSVPGAYTDSDAAYGGTFDGLVKGTDYMGCLISTSKAAEGENLLYANGDIESRYVDTFDEGGAGIAVDSAVHAPDQNSTETDSCPSEVTESSGTVAYDWPAFNNPYPYTDGTTTVATPTPTPTPTPTLKPTVTVSPFPTTKPTDSSSGSSGTSTDTSSGNVPAEAANGY